MNNKKLLDLIVDEIKETKKQIKKWDHYNDIEMVRWWQGYHRALDFILGNIIIDKKKPYKTGKYIIAVSEND